MLMTLGLCFEITNEIVTHGAVRILKTVRMIEHSSDNRVNHPKTNLSQTVLLPNAVVLVSAHGTLCGNTPSPFQKHIMATIFAIGNIHVYVYMGHTHMHTNIHILV